jgi:Ca-activated chloride channel family protein
MRLTARSHAALVATAALAITAMPRTAPGAPPLRFSSNVDVVNLTVTASDAASHIVGDLSQNDFVVYEDGVPQQLTVFAHETVPLSVAIMIDVSSSMQPRLRIAQDAALRLVHALSPQDEAEVIAFNHRASVLQDFTSDQAKIAEAIRSTSADGATALYTALYVALKDLSARRTGDLRRFAIVVLSDGDDTVSSVTDDQVTDLARRSGITVYGVSLQSTQRASVFAEPADQMKAFFLPSLSRDTGGLSQTAMATQLQGVYDRIAEELHSQYSIGYVSSNPARDGRWRHISVATPSRSLQLRYRLGYFAPRP